MEDKNTPKLSRCRCGEPNPIMAQLRSGQWICACQGCPTHVYGATEAEARENWEKAVQK